MASLSLRFIANDHTEGFAALSSKKIPKLPTSTEKSLLNLAGLLNIPQRHGWKTKLAKWWGINLTVLIRWINRDQIPTVELARIEKRGYPVEQWLIVSKEEPPAYEQPEEHMLPRSGELGRDSDPAQAGRSEIEAHRVTTLVVSDEEWYIEALRQVLRSEDQALAENLRGHIREAHDKLLMRDRLRRLERELWRAKRAREEEDKQPPPAGRENAGGGEANH